MNDLGARKELYLCEPNERFQLAGGNGYGLGDMVLPQVEVKFLQHLGGSRTEARVDIAASIAYIFP